MNLLVSIHWELFFGSTYELIKLPGGYRAPPHLHNNSKAIIQFIVGNGQILIGNKWFNYRKGGTFVIPKKTKHGFKVKKDTLFLSVNTPGILDYKSGKVDVEY